jgi:hypothetical protein
VRGPVCGACLPPSVGQGVAGALEYTAHPHAASRQTRTAEERCEAGGLGRGRVGQPSAVGVHRPRDWAPGLRHGTRVAAPDRWRRPSRAGTAPHAGRHGPTPDAAGPPLRAPG